jgi:hypothetical protein
VRRGLRAALGGALLFLACQQPEAAPPRRAAPSPPAPPPRALTLCERAPKPAAKLQDAKTEASFRAFSLKHLEKLRKAGAARSASARKQIPAEFETEVRSTASKQAPWVGILRYCEQTVNCQGVKSGACKLSRSSVVSEIFRFQGGKWVY